LRRFGAYEKRREEPVSEDDCVFCKIVRGEMESEVVHDEEEVLAFEDISGQAPVHVLVVPKEHVSSLAEVGKLSDAVTKRLFEVAREVAEKMDIAESGYVLRINNGPDAGQEVFHLHAHVMGGERLGMP
jgi:histidine triad (HIT) family protein